MKRPLIRSLGFATAVLLLAQGAMTLAREDKKEEPFKRLTVEKVHQLMADPAVHIYDGNTDKVYLKGHIPGAVHLLSRNMKEEMLPKDKGATLIFYCHNER